MDTIQVEPIGEATGEGLRRTRGWVLPLAPWIVAVVLGAALLWIVPRASASHAASTRNVSLSSSVAMERSAAASASAALASTQAQLSNATKQVRTFGAAARHRRAEIARLQAQGKKLRAEKARLSAPPATSTTPIVGKIGPPPPCHIVYYPDGSVGLKCG